MGIFVMGGAQINGPLKFRSHFDPEDFLRSLELAAGFAYMQLRGLSALDKNNSEVLYQAVFAGKGCLNAPLSGSADYLSQKLGAFSSMTLKAAELKAVRALGEAPGVKETLRSVWDTAEAARGELAAAHVSDVAWEKTRLFLALSGGYFLARTAPAERPVSPAAAAAAYLKRPRELDSGRWLCLKAGTVTLAQRSESYRILMDEPAMEGMIPGTELELCRVEAGNGSVVLELHLGEFDTHPVMLEIAAGDYRYFTLAGDRPVYLHPLEVKNGYYTMIRRGMDLYHGKHQALVQVAEVKDIVDFAPEADGGGWITLGGDGKTDLSHYSKRAIPAARRLSGGGCVQLVMEGKACRVLRSDGTVVSNLFDIHGRGLTVLR